MPPERVTINFHSVHHSLPEPGGNLTGYSFSGAILRFSLKRRAHGANYGEPRLIECCLEREMLNQRGTVEFLSWEMAMEIVPGVIVKSVKGTLWPTVSRVIFIHACATRLDRR